jgi:cytochrome bd ubiquinol oxidase subunit II
MPDLQTIWFLLVGVLLVGYAVLDGFDLGVGALHLLLAKDDRERRVLLNSVGPVWDGNEVWLLTGGGALFAAFPPVYATVFSGFYLALMLLLAMLILRAVAMEFRSKESAAAWRRFWDGAFAVSSALPAVLFGVALGNVLRGLPLDGEGEFAGTFLGLLNPFAVLVGLLALAMVVLQGACWLQLKTEAALRERARLAALRAWSAFGVLWLIATVASLGTAPRLWSAYRSILAWLAPLVLVAAMLALRVALVHGRAGRAFLLSSITIAALLGIVGQALYPSLVPALDPASTGLTIYNTASSPLTLKTMLAIALLGMPVVLGYTIFIYRSFRGPVVLDEASY